MNETLKHLIDRFGVGLNPRRPIELTGIDRDGLAALFCELGFKIGAEIGVEQGKYSEILLKKNPGLRLYCVDSWTRYHGYRDHVDQEKLNGFLKATEDRLLPYDAVICRGYSMDVVKKFKRDSLDFVYIDGNHTLPYIIQDIWQWSQRVRPGGIVSGHDYNEHPNIRYQCHVVDAVNAWTSCYHVDPWFIVGEPSIETRGKRLRRNRSWFWVKE